MIFNIFYVLLNLIYSFCIIIFGAQLLFRGFQIFFYLLCFQIGTKFLIDCSKMCIRDR